MVQLYKSHTSYHILWSLYQYVKYIIFLALSGDESQSLDMMAASNKYGAGVRHGRGIQQEDKTQDTELAIQQARKWIEVSEVFINCSQFSNSCVGMYQYITT